MIFAAIALITKEPRWQLDEQEGKLLGERLGVVLDGKSHNKKLRKALDKHAPVILFLLALVAVLAPRWSLITKDKTHANALPQNRTEPGASGAPGQPTTSDVPRDLARGNGAARGEQGARSNGASPRPFRRADYRELFGSDE